MTRRTHLSYTKNWREWLLGLVGLAAVIAVSSFPAIPQDPGYHHFADDRTLFGLPNFWNVVSNLPFFFVGIFGFIKYFRNEIPGAGVPYIVFCAGVFLVGAGSAYYHHAPSPQTLLWDRLPMTLAFMAMFSMVVSDRISDRLGAKLLWPLVLLGVASVSYWYWTETQGLGDLRPYVVVQFLPMILIPLMLLIYPGKAMTSSCLWGTLAAYALAKAAEYFDLEIFEIVGFWSGHTFKHLLAALAVLWVILSFRSTVSVSTA